MNIPKTVNILYKGYDVESVDNLHDEGGDLYGQIDLNDPPKMVHRSTKKALSGAPLSNIDGVYMFDCEIPLTSSNISKPSVNNGAMYTAYGVPGGYLLSGELETVVSGTYIDEIFKGVNEKGKMGEQIVDGKKIIGYWLK